MKKPLYNSNEGRVARPRKQKRKIGEMPAYLKAEAARYGITKIALGMSLISLGVDVTKLTQ